MALFTTQLWTPYIYINRAYPFLSAAVQLLEFRVQLCITADHNLQLDGCSFHLKPNVLHWDLSESDNLSSRGIWMRIIVSRGRVGMHTHTHIHMMCEIRPHWCKNLGCCCESIWREIYSATVQALSIQTRWSLPAGSQRRQHSCLRQHCRPLRAAVNCDNM